MEDELDRRGPRPLEAAPPYPWFTGGVVGGGGAVGAGGEGGGGGEAGGGGEGYGAVKSPTTAATASTTAAAGKSPAGDEGGKKEAGGGDEPLPLSPRGKGYLARLVLEVCSELDESKKVGGDGGFMGGWYWCW